MFNKLYWLIIFLLFSKLCFAEKILTLKPNTNALSVTPYITIYEDTHSLLTVEQIAAPTFSHNFIPVSDSPPNKGFSNSTFWIKLSVENGSNVTYWLLKNKFNAINYVDFYELDNDKPVSHLTSGTLRSLSQRSYQSHRITFPLTIPKGQTNTYLIKFTSLTPIIINLELLSETAFNQSESIDYTIIGLFWGMMIILLLVNLLFYSFLKLKSQLYLSVYILGVLIAYSLYDGSLLPIISESVVDYSVIILLLCGSIAIVSGYFYLEELLLKDKPVMLRNTARGLMLSYWGINTALLLTTNILLPYKLASIGFFIFPLLGVIYSGIAWLKKQYHARFVFIGLTSLAVSYYIQMNYLLGSTNSKHLLLFESGRVGSVIFVVLLSLAIIDYVRKLEYDQKDTRREIKRAENRFKQIFDQAYQMLFLVSSDGKILSANNEVERFLDINNNTLVDKAFIDVFSSLRGVFDKDIIKKNIQSALNGKLTTQNIVAYATDGTLKDLEMSFQPFIKDGREINNVIIQVRDITKQVHAFNAIQDMVIGIAGLSTENFFKNFLIEISRIYNAKYVALSQLNDTFPHTATTIAITQNYKTIENFTFSIENSPCQRMLNEHLCNYPKDVQKLFPNDKWLREHNIESYLGVNIRDTDNQIIGFLSVMDEAPLHEDNYFIEVLDVFAARIANELRHQESQDALKKALEKLDFHITNTPLGVIEWDTHFNITKWNKAAEKIFGFTLEHFKDHDPIDTLLPKEEHDHIRDVAKELLENKGGYYTLSRNLTMDGREIICEWHNTPILNNEQQVIGVASLINDVTAEHEALNALYLKEQEQREIFNALLDAVFIVNHQAEIISTNNAATKLFGYSTKEFIGKSIKTLMSEEQAKDHDKYFEAFLSEGQSKVIGVDREVQGKKKNGHVFPIHISVAKLPNDQQGQPRLLATCHDLTELKQQQESLRQSQKMDALGNLTGGIAHDFNNLLGIINGYADLLAGGITSDSKLSSYAQHIQKASKRGAKLTKKLLSFSRKNIIEKELVDLNHLLNDEFEMLQKTITPRINLTYILDEHLPLTNLDKAGLEDSILNLVINAMHAIPKHGEITIKTSLITLDQQYATSHHVSAGKYVKLAVQDDGVGMDKETQQKALEPFFTTKGQKGTGLGLSQVYGFVERSKGYIDIQSTLGKGTSINIYLPIDEQQALTKAPEKIMITNSVHSATILVVDDEPSLVELASTILANAGYHVVCAFNAEQALKVLKKQSVDAMLCDVIMPNIDGIELANMVHKQYPNIAILLVSGYYEQEQLSEQTFPIDSILKKPYKAEQLLQRLDQLFNKQATN